MQPTASGSHGVRRRSGTVRAGGASSRKAVVAAAAAVVVVARKHTMSGEISRYIQKAAFDVI